MEAFECQDCGADDAVVYITTEYGCTYCGPCVRGSSAPRRKRQKAAKPVEVAAPDLVQSAEAFERPLYRMHDSDPSKGCQLIRAGETPGQWQAQGFGIFWAVNRFRGGVRRVDHLERILAWAVDIDEGTKDAQRARFLGAPLVPSLIVETKRGYQAYWNAKDARPEHWNAIVLHRLVPYFGADQNARDLARILRAPGYLHLKDPADPFPVRVVHKRDVAYTEAQMVAAFPDSQKVKRDRAEREAIKREVRFAGSDDFWERVYQLDCEEGLRRLSGHASVGGERYTFRQVASGNRNIFVDGKGTSCWVDKNGHIGSLAGGGPTLAQWLKWFGLSYGEAAKVIKELFPEITR